MGAIRSSAERLFAWACMVAVAAGLRWDYLPNTAPPTTVLMKEGLIEFEAKSKTGGMSEGIPWAASHYAFSKKEWIRNGYVMFRNDSVEFNRDFGQANH